VGLDRRAGRSPEIPLVKRQQVSLATLQLSLMMSSGVDILRALETLERSSADRAHQEMFATISGRLLEGHTLSVALGEYPHCFPPLYVAMIQVGERTGGLARVLERLADWLGRENHLQQRVQAALIYPALILCLCFLLIFTLFAVVMPGLIQGLQDSMDGLPGPTRVALALVTALRSPLFWFSAMASLVALFALLCERLKSPFGRRQLYELGLNLPGLGPILMESSLARFADSAGFMLEVGLDLIRTLRMAASASQNPVLMAEIDLVVAGIQEGEPLSELFAQLSYAPAMLWRLTQVGEESARLSSTFKNLAQHFDSEVEYRIEGLMSLLEPALMMLMAGLVGFAAVAVLLPLYSTISNLS